MDSLPFHSGGTSLCTLALPSVTVRTVKVQLCELIQAGSQKLYEIVCVLMAPILSIVCKDIWAHLGLSAVLCWPLV